MAKKKTKTKRTTKKTARNVSSRSRSTAKKSSTGKKKVAKRPARKTTKKKAPAKRAATSKVAKKKTTRKKTAAGGSPTKKKSTTRKKAATSKKQATPTTSRKTAKKTTARGSTKKTAKKKAAGKKVSSKKPTTKKKTSRSGREGQAKIKGRSVAEVASTEQADAEGYVVINGRRVRMVSLKGVDRTKKKKTTRAAAAEVGPTELPPSKRKTKLARKDLKYFQTLLIERRRDIVGNLGSMENEALRSNGGEVSHMPNHMADIGSDTYEQDFMLGLAEGERKRLKEIDLALARIAEGTYGMCMMTGKPIPRARLEAKPWARYTIEAAREMERTGYGS